MIDYAQKHSLARTLFHNETTQFKAILVSPS